MRSSYVTADALSRPIYWSGPEWTLNQDIVLRLFRSDSPHGGRLLRLRSDSPHGGHLCLPRSDSPQRGHPHLSEWDLLQTQGLAPPGDPFLGIHALQGHAPPGIPSLHRRGSPSPKRRRYESRDSVSPHQHHSSRSGTVFRRSHRTVGSNRSATTDPFPPLESDLPVPQLTMWLLSTDSPVSPAFLRQVIHDFPSFKGRSDLWIFKLDGLPLRCDAKLMLDHPHCRLPSLLNSWPFCLGAITCPLYHHMVWVLGLWSSTLISSALEVTFWSLFSHSSNLIIDLVPALNKIILIPWLLVNVLT